MSLETCKPIPFNIEPSLYKNVTKVEENMKPICPILLSMLMVKVYIFVPTLMSRPRKGLILFPRILPFRPLKMTTRIPSWVSLPIPAVRFTLSHPCHTLVITLKPIFITRLSCNIIHGKFRVQFPISGRTHQRTLMALRLPNLSFEKFRLTVFLSKETPFPLFDMVPSSETKTKQPYSF